MKHKMNAADVITASRIVFAVIVLFCPPFSIQFYVFYLLGAFTDMIDGRIARKLDLQSSFGSKLDAIADFVFVIAVMIKVLPTLYVPEWQWIWIAIIALIKIANLVSSLVMFHRIVSAHTIMNKVTGAMLFLLPFFIGSGSSQALTIAVIIVCSTATFAAMQEGHHIRTGKETT